jgi:hypothetical protein
MPVYKPKTEQAQPWRIKATWQIDGYNKSARAVTHVQFEITPPAGEGETPEPIHVVADQHYGHWVRHALPNEGETPEPIHVADLFIDRAENLLDDGTPDKRQWGQNYTVQPISKLRKQFPGFQNQLDILATYAKLHDSILKCIIYYHTYNSLPFYVREREAEVSDGK